MPHLNAAYNLARWLTRNEHDAEDQVQESYLRALREWTLKFVYANQGVGRFTKLGLPAPALTADFVGTLEIVGGVLLIAGFLTRLIAVPFIIEMLVAILTTKI